MDDIVVSLLEENEWIERELFTPGTVENSIWCSNAPKRDLITRWAGNLEKLHEAGIYTDEVSSISSYISDKLRKNNMYSSVHWVRHSLDFKYKRDYSIDDALTVENGRQDRLDSSILIQDEAILSNKLLISFYKRTIVELGKAMCRLTKDVILEPKIPANELEQMMLIWDNMLQKHREAWDGREKVLSTQQYIMGYCLANYSLNHSYSKYLLYQEKKLTLTPKQAGKLKKLQVKKVQDIFDPKNFEEAMDLGFYGQQCEKCGSWRTERRYNNDQGTQKDQLYCFAEHPKDITPWGTLKTMRLNEVTLN